MTTNLEDFGTPRLLSSDLKIAIVSVVLIFVAKPLVAQTFGAETATAPMAVQPNQPAAKYGGVDRTDVFPGSYVNPLVSPTQDKSPKTGSSQSERSANAEQNNPTNQQTAPTFVR